MRQDRPPQQRSLVRNAADPRQVKNAKRIEEDAERRYLIVLRAVMQTYEGREFISLEFERLGLHTATFNPQSMISAYNQGRHNAALELLAKVELAGDQGGDHPNLHEVMLAERRVRRVLQERAIDAAHTPSAEETEGEDR